MTKKEIEKLNSEKASISTVIENIHKTKRYIIAMSLTEGELSVLYDALQNAEQNGIAADLLAFLNNAKYRSEQNGN